MTPFLTLLLCLVMLATAFLSGLFGMAGGMILIGVLLALLPLPAAMVLHAVTQMASNGWRAVLWRRHIAWAPVCSNFLGAALALLAVVAVALRAVEAADPHFPGADAVPGSPRAGPLRARSGKPAPRRRQRHRLHDADAARRRVGTAARYLLSRRSSRSPPDRRHQGGDASSSPTPSSWSISAASSSRRRRSIRCWRCWR